VLSLCLIMIGSPRFLGNLLCPCFRVISKDQNLLPTQLWAIDRYLNPVSSVWIDLPGYREGSSARARGNKILHVLHRGQLTPAKQASTGGNSLVTNGKNDKLSHERPGKACGYPCGGAGPGLLITKGIGKSRPRLCPTRSAEPR
jgi:hypothetical protein